MAKYELVVIYDPFLQEAEHVALIDRTRELVTRRGSELTNVDVWGRRRLAYPIAKKEEGYYAVFSFESAPDNAAIAEIERSLRLNESVLRAQVTRIPVLKPSRRALKKAAKKSQSSAENYQEERQYETHSAGQAGAGSGAEHTSGPAE